MGKILDLKKIKTRLVVGMSIFEILLNREVSGHFYSSCKEEQERLILLSYLPKKHLFDELLASYEDAVIAVRYPALFQKLTFNQRLEVLGRHKPFAQELLMHQEFMHQLNADNLRHLGRYSTEISQYIMNNLERFHLVNEEEVSRLTPDFIRQHADVEAKNEWQDLERLQKILDEPSRYDELDIDTLKTWGYRDPDFALCILGNNEIKTKMSRFNLCAYSELEERAQVGKSFRKICHSITHSPIDISLNASSNENYKKKC